MSIKSVFHEIARKTDSKVAIRPSVEVSEPVPAALKALYNYCDGVELPFGAIFSIAEAIEESENPPFASDWFVFGRDRYFDFWLCAWEPHEEGLWITSWDHEGGAEIDGAVFETIEEFLMDCLDEHLEEE